MPKFISVADPASRWTGASGGLVFFACCTNLLIDLKHAMIMDVEATTAVRQVEVTAQRIMLDRTQKRFGLWSERLAADSGYGDAANLAWLVHERGIEPHIPVFEKNRTDGTFGRDDFGYDHQTDSYSCPGGKQLRQYWQPGRAAKAKPPSNGFYRYRARKVGCQGCEWRERCRPGDAGRKVLRSIHEGARDLARDLAMTDAYATSQRERKKVEVLFAHLKRILSWIASGSGDLVAPRMSSSSPQPPRTSESWPNAADQAGADAHLIRQALIQASRARPSAKPSADFFNAVRGSRSSTARAAREYLGAPSDRAKSGGPLSDRRRNLASALN
jgi:hypothetical protein